MRKRLGKGIFSPHQRMRDLWFSICGFFGIVSNYSPESFALLARFFRKAYFNNSLCQGHVILCDRNNFGAIFFALSPFVSLC